MITVTIKRLNEEPYEAEVKILGKRKLRDEYYVLVKFSNFTTQYMSVEEVHNCPDLSTLPTLKGLLE
jgi:hypothetical protein